LPERSGKASIKVTRQNTGKKSMDEDSNLSDLTTRLEKALEQSGIKDNRLNQKIHTLLYRSVEYDRATRVLGENPDDAACHEYVNQVITNYQECHEVVTRLERREPEEWETAVKKINRWANGCMKQWNIYGPLRKQCVEECVPNAVLAFLTGTYHYDTEFDAWLCVLVQNVCRKYIKEQLHPNHAAEADALSYDKFEFLLEALADNDAIASQRARELRAILLEAVEKLSSEARQELIILHYFEGFSFKEIAQKMDRSLNAVYKLHFDALNELREILDGWY
jgi:RNA polymerase sigma factor (sigma-70 family)